MERIVAVKQLDEQFGPYHVTGTVTQIWDPEAARRIKAIMLSHMLQMTPQELAAAAKQDPDSVAD